MQFSAIIADIEKVSGIQTTSRATLKRGVQSWLYRYAASYPWPHYRDRGVIQTIAPYSTGTVAITNGDKTLTITTGVFTAAMVGRKVQIADDQAWYTIASYTSASEVELAEAYQGTTQTVATFSIFQDEYRLDGDTQRLLDVVQTEHQVQLLVYDYLSFDELFSAVETTGNPEILTLLGRKQDSYATGTITGSSGGSTLTGSSTAWTGVEGLTKGSRIQVSSNSEVYTVKSVDSDTSITIYELIATAFSASAYQVVLDNLRVQVRPVPDAARNLYYRKQRRPTPLVNDRDEPDMPMEFHGMLVDAGLEVAWTLLGHLDRAGAMSQRLASWISQQADQIGVTMPYAVRHKRSSDSTSMLPPLPRFF